MGNSIVRKGIATGIVCLSVFLCTSAANVQPAQRSNRNNPTTSRQTPSTGRRFVTINLKTAPSVTGTFISATEQLLVIQLQNGTRKTITLDAVVSIVFLDGGTSSQGGKRSSKEREAAEAALKALRGIAAATEVGIAIREYGSRVIDAKLIVEDALGRISDDALKSEIREATDDYSFAVTVWDYLNSYNTDLLPLGSYFPADNSVVQQVLKQYHDITPTVLNDGGKYYRINSLLSGIWGAADKHIEKASAMLGR
jgi:hypothetical protein